MADLLVLFGVRRAQVSAGQTVVVEVAARPKRSTLTLKDLKGELELRVMRDTYVDLCIACDMTWRYLIDPDDRKLYDGPSLHSFTRPTTFNPQSQTASW